MRASPTPAQLENNQKLLQYYDNTRFFYNRIWRHNSLHIGLWSPGTRRLKQALENTNDFVSDLLELKKGDRVLDAGCGVGGTAVSIAKQNASVPDLQITGITLSKLQAEQANRLAAKEGVKSSVRFETMDFNNTSFADGSFTKVYAVESVCCNVDKMDFLNEMNRLLSDGGKLVVMDGFLSQNIFTAKEDANYRKLLCAWRVPGFSHLDDFTDMLLKAGFRYVQYWDTTPEAIRSSKIIARLGYLLLPFAYLLSKVGLASHVAYENIQGMVAQRGMMGKIGSYGAFTAEKMTPYE